MWQEIWLTIVSEFTDIQDIQQMTQIVLRLLVAGLLGGLLGYEREQKGKSAGIRTHMLVSIGAALFVLIPQQAGASTADLTRVLQGLTAGVGFLGAGTIILGTQQTETKGLTTAAGIWVTAAIGIAAAAFFKIVVAQSCFKQPLFAPARVSRAAPDLASRHR